MTLQSPGSSSSSSLNPADRPQAARIELGGAAVTLETNEPLFQMAAALNACGYDADLNKSAPVRAERWRSIFRHRRRLSRTSISLNCRHRQRPW